MTEDRIRMIREGLALLNPLKIKIEDEGHLHVGHAGAKSGGHFKLYIVSQSFNNMSQINRHKLIYKTLSELLKTRLILKNFELENLTLSFLILMILVFLNFLFITQKLKSILLFI